MPELPEVETTRRGIEPHIREQRVRRVIVRQSQLRWPVPPRLAEHLQGQLIHHVERRAKYLLLGIGSGTVILHLGMSGSLRIVDADSAVGKHDHLDIVLDNGRALRLTDPRRFGAVLWTTRAAETHKLLRRLGPEPLSKAFNGEWLYPLSRKRKAAIKNFIMDSKVVVGIGNIYASEALFRAGIHPKRAACRLSRERYERLANSIKRLLTEAIEQGGTTLRNFVSANGRPGYFAQKLQVYGRTGEPCLHCGTTIKQITLGQRSSFYCPHCQR